MNSPLDPALIQLVQQELKSLQDDVKNMSVEYDKERNKVESELQNCASVLEELRQRVECLETGQQNIKKTVDELKARVGFVEDQISEGEGNVIKTLKSIQVTSTKKHNKSTPFMINPVNDVHF